MTRRYDVEENQDVFYKEVPDGVNVLLVDRTQNNKWGLLTDATAQQNANSNNNNSNGNNTNTSNNNNNAHCIIVGGNCSLQVFDNLGAEVMWTVTGTLPFILYGCVFVGVVVVAMAA